MKRLSCLLMSTFFLLPPPGAWPQTTDEALKEGIRLTQEGEFEAAIAALDPVARKLAKEPGRAQEAARVYVYIAMAYMGLSQEQMAKAKFLEAWRTDSSMELSSHEFPPSVVRLFGEAKNEATGAESGGAATPAPAATTAPPPKKKSKTVPILLGVAAVGGIGAAVAAGGGGDGGSSAPPASTTPPAAPEATVISSVAGQSINCTVPIPITVRVTNPAATSLAITAIRKARTSPAGGCSPGSATYVPDVASVGPGQTATVLQLPSLYANASAGCCRGPCAGTSCTLQETFTVDSSAGALVASMSFILQFVGCIQCPTVASANEMPCPPMR